MNLIASVMCNICVIYNYSHPSCMEGGFKHLEESPINDYHEFKHAHEEYIEERWLYQLPNYVSIANGILASNELWL